MRLKELNPQEGDVIRVKFKPINQIMEEKLGKKSFHEIEDYYGIQSNIKAYIAGGDFLVEGAITEEEGHEDDPYIQVKNHLDCEYGFDVHENVIESIEIVDAAEIFQSHDLKILAVRIGHEMYINGEPLIWNERQKQADDDEYKNHNRKLIKMFESFIADLAVRDTFHPEDDEG